MTWIWQGTICLVVLHLWRITRPRLRFWHANITMYRTLKRSMCVMWDSWWTMQVGGRLRWPNKRRFICDKNEHVNRGIVVCVFDYEHYGHIFPTYRNNETKHMCNNADDSSDVILWRLSMPKSFVVFSGTHACSFIVGLDYTNDHTSLITGSVHYHLATGRCSHLNPDTQNIRCTRAHYLEHGHDPSFQSYTTHENFELEAPHARPTVSTRNTSTFLNAFIAELRIRTERHAPFDPDREMYRRFVFEPFVLWLHEASCST